MTDMNWVRGRSECSTAAMFELLKQEVEKDVNQRNELRSDEEKKYYAFSCVAKGDSVTVLLQSEAKRRAAVFFLKGKEIIVKLDDVVLFSATLTLNNEGECRFKISGEERESWQLRKLALEAIFFESF